MSVQFTYNQDQAVRAGQSQFINETGAYSGKIISAKYTASQGGAQALELSFESADGLKSDYLSIYYTNKNGESLQGGINMIQAIMGCTGSKQLTRIRQGNDDIAPELSGKAIGLMLQKVLYTKNNGDEGYRFQILCPFSAQSRKTLAEHLENRPAERIDYLVTHTKDKDDRDQARTAFAAQHQHYSGGQPYALATQFAPPADNFDDDIPF